MSRTSTTIALVLTLLTGIVLGHLTALDAPSFSPQAAGGDTERRIELVQSFYDGLNAYLATGDDRFLRLLAPGYQDMDVLGPGMGSVDTLMTRLDALRASAAVPTFTIEEIHDLDHVVQVRVSTGLPEGVSAGGFTIAKPVGDSALEFLQIRGNAIAARWGQDDLIPQIDLALSDTLALGAPMFLLGVERITLAPAIEWALPHENPAWVVVESGTIAIGPDGTTATLGAGEIGSYARTAIGRIANPTPDPISFWLISITIIPSSLALIPGAIAPLPAGVGIELLSRSIVVAPSAEVGRLGVELSRLTAAPGTSLVPRDDAVGHEVVVIDGTVDGSIAEGDALHATRSGITEAVRGAVSITAGQALTALSPTSVSYRVTGSHPAELLLFTVSVDA